MATIVITAHAYDRAKERLNINKQSLDRLAPKAFNDGLSYKKCSGKLRKFIDSKRYKFKECNESNSVIRVYGEFVYVFAISNNRMVLITILSLPNYLKGKTKTIKNKLNKK